MRNFRDFQPGERRNYITLSTGEYYPDILSDACRLYTPVLETFGQLLRSSASSASLFMSIAATPTQWMRTQLCRVFRKYVSPETPVEMLKKSTKAAQICQEFGNGFRPIHIVQEKFEARPSPDETICALLWEYKDRGKKGYDLTEKFFDLMQGKFPELCIGGLNGPVRMSRQKQFGRIILIIAVRWTLLFPLMIRKRFTLSVWQDTMVTGAELRKMTALEVIRIVLMKFWSMFIHAD